MNWWQAIIFSLGWLAVGLVFGRIMGKGINIADKKENHESDT